jgi:hypothetical protein
MTVVKVTGSKTKFILRIEGSQEIKFKANNPTECQEWLNCIFTECNKAGVTLKLENSEGQLLNPDIIMQLK